MLKWNKATAARRAKIGEATVQRIRLDQTVTEGNRERLIDAMKDAGAEFGSDGWVRVKAV